MYKLLIIVILFLFYLTFPCNYFNKAISGKYYTSRDIATANVIDQLRNISFMLANDLSSPLKEKLKQKLIVTSFKELIGDDRTVLAWNYDKGREIAIRIYNTRGTPFSAKYVLSSLFHEIAHSLDKNLGHGQSFKILNDTLQLNVDNYVDILKNNTFLQ